MNNIGKELFGKKKIDIICSRGVRVVIQKINIKISQDKNLFVTNSWSGQDFLQVVTKSIYRRAWMKIAQNIALITANFPRL